MNWVVVKVLGVVLIEVVDVVVNDLLVIALVAKFLVLVNSLAISKLTDPEEIPLEICFVISKYNLVNAWNQKSSLKKKKTNL